MKIDLKQLLLYAIVPALIAGLFSIAPKIYEVIVEPKANLRYTLATGPQIDIDGALQQVISVRITNAGKKPLTSIYAELGAPHGEVIASSVENASGLTIESTKLADKIVIKLPKALEGESFSISALLKLTKTSNEPKILLRSDEVLGKIEEPKESSKDLTITLWGAAGAAISVLAMALFGLGKFMSLVVPDRRSAIMYIALATRVEPFIESVQREGENITYMQFADMLLSLGRSNNIFLGRATSGLKSLLFISGMADASKAVVKRNLLLLQEQLDDAEIIQIGSGISLKEEDLLKFRDQVDELFKEPKTERAA